MKSLLVARLARTADLVRDLLTRQGDADVVERHVLLRRAMRRVGHIRWAITLCAHSGIVTGWMVEQPRCMAVDRGDRPAPNRSRTPQCPTSSTPTSNT